MTMKRILAFFTCLILPLCAFAQNQGDATPLGASGTKIMCNVNSALTATASGDGKLNYPACTTAGQLLVSASSLVPGVAATSLGKAEDAVHTTGDTGVMALGVANEASSNISGTDGDYTPIATTRKGAVLVDIEGTHQLNNANGLLKPEDSVAGSGDNGVLPFLVREDALTSSASGSGDYITGKADSSGRQVVAYSPPGEMWNACSGVASGTIDVAIKAAVASNRLYVTSLECTNTASAVSTQLAIDDAAAQVWTMYVASATIGFASDKITFNPPLRMAAVNTALNVKPATTSAAVTCCASGYISTQ